MRFDFPLDPDRLPDLDSLAWEKQQGLLPVIVQEAETRRVLMLGYMNREALQATLSSGFATFHSRSRARLWRKGETSGNGLRVVSLQADCDADALLLQALPEGPTCHLGRPSCFAEAPRDFLSELDRVVAERERERPAGSYSTSLFEAGLRRIAQKVGEEGVETALAAIAQDDEALLGESADLLYHLTVLLRARGLSIQEAVKALESRHR
ncbi:bifunctional phosphoribosyl-AMP cyclohydrolase/phosphoribosyl-ATP diphosphatase HisIE [Arenimonas sp.]|uniref:bifunctional phosphoribosyl-AMP cyclohydrolase/phosphoribosyl-ATP diphosphatase HisIE n=1 Tax=Arenimonas sp. TaxID=1872635 RepID=UPI0039E3806C